MGKALSLSFENFYNSIKNILEAAKNRVYQAANYEMVHAYWEISQAIVKGEQKGKDRAEYGKHLLAELSGRLTADYGKSFDESNLMSNSE